MVKSKTKFFQKTVAAICTLAMLLSVFAPLQSVQASDEQQTLESDDLQSVQESDEQRTLESDSVQSVQENDELQTSETDPVQSVQENDELQTSETDPVQMQASGDLQTLEIEGVGTVYYLVDPESQGSTIHSEADEWDHIDYTIPGIGSKEMRMMNDADIAYYVVEYPIMPDKNGNEVSEEDGGIPATLYGTAKLSHLEYWQGEGVEASTLTDASSAEKDEEGYYDLGGFDTVTRSTLTYGPGHTAFQFENIFYAIDAETYEDAMFAPTFRPPSFTTNSYETTGSPYLAGASGSNHISAESFQAGETQADARDYLLDRYEIPGYESIPVSVNGTTYIENRIKLDAGVGNVPSAFKNVTIGGQIKYFYDFINGDEEDDSDAATFNVDVDADTGLLKHLNNDGTYGKAAEGQSVYEDTAQILTSNGGWGTTGTDYNYSWGNYQDSYIYLQAGDSESTQRDLTTKQYYNYCFHFLGAKYEYYGDIDDLGVSSPEEISTLDDLEAVNATKKAAYGSTFAADTWWAPYKKARIEVGFNFDSLRLGGTGTNTSEGGIYNYGNAQGKTGYYKITLYAAGYENIEKLVYVKSQYQVPKMVISGDLNTITLEDLDESVKTKIINGSAAVTLNVVSGRTSTVLATLDAAKFNADTNSYDVSGAALEADTAYLMVFSFGGVAADITTESITTTSVDGLEMSEATLALKTGASSTLSATISPEGAIVGTAITWSSSDEAVVTVDQDGKVTAKAAGTATITVASGNGKIAACDVTVTEKEAQTLSGTTAYSKTFGNAAFTLNTKVSKGDGALSYVSGNTKVATVNKSTGKVTIVGVGTAKITVTAAETDNYKEATTTVTVSVAKAGQTISAKSFTKAYGAKAFSLGAKRTKGDGKLTYKSSNTKVATVNASGKVTIKATGKATITITAAATTNYKKTTKAVTITVKPKKATVFSVAGSAKKKITVQWKKDSQATGYQIQYSTSSSFKSGNSTKLVNKNTTVKKTLTSLKSGKKYYVRVRSYKTISGKKVYGAWSAKKSVTVK